MTLHPNFENDGQLLTLRISDSVDSHVMDQIFNEVERSLASGIRQILVLRQAADTIYDIDSGLDFGEKIGDLLSGTGIIVAVVKRPDQMEDIAIDTVIYNKGVILAQFDNEQEARVWLQDKRKGSVSCDRS